MENISETLDSFTALLSLPCSHDFLLLQRVGGQGWYLGHGCFRAMSVPLQRSQPGSCGDPTPSGRHPSLLRSDQALFAEPSMFCHFSARRAKKDMLGQGCPVARACYHIQPLTPASPIYFTEPTGYLVGINLHTSHLGAAYN